jgi:hypothetical protein
VERGGLLTTIDWQRVEVVVEGGFAGLKRGASLERDAVAPHDAAHVGSLVQAICALPSAAASTQPDGQSVAIDVHSPGNAPVCRRFDGADLPAPAEELLARLREQLKPLPHA